MNDAEDFNDDDEGGLEEIRGLIRTRGVKAAYTALVEVCEDRKAAAPARSSAGTSLFRAAGLFDRTEGGAPKEPHEMTGDELRAAFARGQRDLEKAVRRTRAEEAADGGDVFD